MLFLVWACMWTSAFFPSTGMTALQNAASALHSSVYAPSLTMTPARQIGHAPLVVKAPPQIKQAPLMALGWASEDDAPIF